MTTRILIAGCAGRMGGALIRIGAASPGVSLVGGVTTPGGTAIGADLGALAGIEPLGVRVHADLEQSLTAADVLVDFTSASASLAHAQSAANRRVPMVIGATGFSAEQERAVEALAERVAIVKSANMSLGAALLAALVEDAARRLPDQFDIEIVETHHRAKVDAPSGTAWMLGRAAARGRGVDVAQRAVVDRAAAGRPRQAGDIGISSLRGGGEIGAHAVHFLGDEEQISLSHRALDRAVFARGAIAAAIWVKGRAPGLYDMTDVVRR